MDNNCINSLNEILSYFHDDLKGIFKIPMKFKEENGCLLFNDIRLCGIDGFKLSVAKYDLERISFHFTNGHFINIYFMWREDKGPELDYIEHGYIENNETIKLWHLNENSTIYFIEDTLSSYI